MNASENTQTVEIDQRYFAIPQAIKILTSQFQRGMYVLRIETMAGVFVKAIIK